MANKSILMRYELSPSPDVVGYRLRVVPAGTEGVSLETPFIDVGNTGEVDLGQLEELQNLDGDYDFYLTAVDDAGLESEFSIYQGKAIDFLAPEPPGAITFEVV